MKNTAVYIQTTLDTVPPSTSATGTITTTTTSNYVNGVGTLFTSEAKVNDWVFDAVTNDEVRRIVKIESDTILIVDEPFTAAIAGGAFRFVSSSLAFIGVLLPTGVTAVIDGAAIPAGTALNWSRTDKMMGSATAYIDPIVVEPTGSAIITTLS